MKSMSSTSLYAAIDLGSNSFSYVGGARGGGQYSDPEPH